MRLVTLVIFMFILHASVAIVNASGMYGDYSKAPASAWLDSVSGNASTASYTANEFSDSGTASTWTDIIFAIKGTFYFAISFLTCLAIVPYTFMMFGVPTATAIMVSIPFYMIYLLGIAQWMTDRSTEGMR